MLTRTLYIRSHTRATPPRHCSKSHASTATRALKTTCQNAKKCAKIALTMGMGTAYGLESLEISACFRCLHSSLRILYWQTQRASFSLLAPTFTCFPRVTFGGFVGDSASAHLFEQQLSKQFGAPLAALDPVSLYNVDGQKHLPGALFFPASAKCWLSNRITTSCWRPAPSIRRRPRGVVVSARC